MRWVIAAALVAACGPKGSGPGTGTGTGTGGEEVDVEVDEDERVAALEKGVNDLAPAAHLCWAAAATDDYQLAGEVKLLVEIGDDGTTVATVHEDTTRDAVLTRCLVDVAQGYQWAPPMRGGSTLLPFAFSAPKGQYVIDRALIPTRSGARVLLDYKNSGNAAASVFEVAGDGATTASERREAWIDLESLEAVYYPPKAARTAAKGRRYLVVSVPGGTEDATRESGVLPAGPAGKQAPAPIVATPFTAERRGVGKVRIVVEQPELSVTILETVADAAIPEHVHDGSTELLYVLDGGGTMVVDGVTLPITATSVVQVPPGVPHAFTASAPTKAIQIYTPAGPEQRFKQK